MRRLCSGAEPQRPADGSAGGSKHERGQKDRTQSFLQNGGGSWTSGMRLLSRSRRSEMLPPLMVPEATYWTPRADLSDISAICLPAGRLEDRHRSYFLLKTKGIDPITTLAEGGVPQGERLTYP